jgi:hypothetical protein
LATSDRNATGRFERQAPRRKLVGKHTLTTVLVFESLQIVGNETISLGQDLVKETVARPVESALASNPELKSASFKPTELLPKESRRLFSMNTK